jgi:hypothetical protein
MADDKSKVRRQDSYQGEDRRRAQADRRQAPVDGGQVYGGLRRPESDLSDETRNDRGQQA